MLYVRDAKPSDVDTISPDIRSDDRREISSIKGRSPEHHLKLAILHSRCAKTVVDDAQNILAIFGVGDGPEPSVGMPWLCLSSRFPQKNHKLFLKETHRWLEAFNRLYPVLLNFKDTRNTRHIKWLKWCGFKHLNTHRNFANTGQDFHQLVRIQNVH